MMNIKSLFNLVVDVMDLFKGWLSTSENELAWCPIRVDNRFDK